MRIPLSKLLQPRLGGSVIDRTWLLRPPPVPSPRSPLGPHPAPRIGSDGEPSVVLLSAPAGAGKTTLMAEWARSCMAEGERVAWLTLDTHDNDRVLFWTALLTAAHHASVAGPAGGGPADLEDVHADGLGHRQPLVRLEALVGRPPGGRLWLFLDDLQEVSSADVLADLDELIRALPPGLRVVLATRRDPPLGVHRLLLAGRLREIRAADLALQRPEVRQVLGDHGVVLDDAGLTLLMQRTEGWAAGVRLAALSLAGAPNPQAMVQDFAGDEREVADYLAAEVLGALSRADRDRLRICAVPEQLTAELAVTLTEDPGAPRLLERLYRENALVEQLAEPGRWYRLHTLLRGFLVADLRRGDPAGLSRLHARTARWFADRHRPDWALTHAVAAADPALTVRMLAAHGPSLLADGRGRLLQQVIDSAGAEVTGHPAVEALATLAALECDAAFAPPAVPLPRAAPTAGGPAVDERQGTVLTALVGLERARRIDTRLAGAALAASSTVDAVPDDDLTMLLRQSRGVVRILADDLDAAEAELREAARLAGASDNRPALLRSTASLSALAACRGDQRRAWDLAEQSVRLSASVDATHNASVALAVLQAAHAAYQRLDHAAAGTLAGWASAVAERGAQPTVQLSGVALQAAVDVHEGVAPHDAARRLRDCWTTAAGHPVAPLTAIRVAFAQHRCGCLSGHADWAGEALQRLEATLGPGGDLDVLTATEHLVRGRGAAARRRLQPVLAGTRGCALPLSLQQGWLVEAVLTAAAGQSARSHAALRAALTLADELDALHAFLDVPGVVRLLEDDTLRFGRLDPLAERIRSAAAARGVPDRVPLTPRELDVLTDLPSQLTLEEIAARQQISLNTVKTHVRAIYQKLEAASRRQAVLTARHRGLL